MKYEKITKHLVYEPHSHLSAFYLTKIILSIYNCYLKWTFFITLNASRCFRGLDRLQVIDLSHNHVEQLQTSQFSGMEQLRLLDLSHNHVRSLSRDVFRKTALERLDLSRNEFVEVPVGALSEIGATLRHLSLSHNHLEHLDSTMFQVFISARIFIYFSLNELIIEKKMVIK